MTLDRQGWNQRYEAADLVWTATPNQFLVAEVESLPPGRALDLAAGEGRNAVWLAQQGWDVTAVDFSDVGLEKAKRLAAEAGVAVATVCVDVADYRPPPEGFDLVVVLYLHLPEAQRRHVHRTAAEAVSSGGTLVVVGHDVTNLADGHGGPQDPSVLLDPADVVADLAGSGLQIDKAERVRRTVQTAEGDRVAIDALVRAHRP